MARLQRYLLAVFGLHLLLPLAILLDSLWNRRGLSLSETGVAVASAAWLIIGVAALVLSQRSDSVRDALCRAVLPLWSVLLTCAAAELALFLYERPLNPGPTLMTPGTRVVTDPDPAILPGVDGLAVGRVNQLGMRGPSTKLLNGRDSVYKIFTVGGSTTICDYLDDSETWPSLLMQLLNKRQNGRYVFVSNAGFTQHSCAHHLELLRSMPVLKDADLLVFLVGINDLMRTLHAEGRPTQNVTARSMQRLRELLGNSLYSGRTPRYKRLRLVQLVQRIVGGWGKEDPAAREYRERRQIRKQYPIVPLPDLSVGLAEYRHFLDKIIEHCRSTRQRCLFLTQPTLWRDDLTSEEESLLWFGGVGQGGTRKGYGEPAELAKAMDAYNQTLIEVCRRAEVEVFDLAAAVPKNTSIFYDECHFTEHGAAVVAHLLAEKLAHRPPFAALSPPRLQQIQ